MPATIQFTKKIAAVFLLGILSAALFTACGSDSGASGGEVAIERVVDDGRIYTVEEFEALRPSGVKTVKDYDVDELPAALGAVQAVYNQLAYEIRFYETDRKSVA